MQVLIFLLVSLLVSCVEKAAPRAERVVVEIAGDAITVGEFDRFVERSVQQDEPFLASDVMEALFEQFIEEQLLLRAADDAGVRVDPKAVERRLEGIEKGRAAEPSSSRGTTNVSVFERQLRIEKLVETRLFDGLEVTDEEVAAQFEANRAFFERPESVTVSQILVDDRELAERIREELGRDPGRFEELAHEHSVGPEADHGGRLGSFARGELPPSFEDAVFALPPGRISDVIATDFGFHIFRVHDKTESEPLTLEAVQDAIRVDLLRDKSARELERFIEELKRTYPVTVHREHLSFAFLEWEDGKADGDLMEASP